MSVDVVNNPNLSSMDSGATIIPLAGNNPSHYAALVALLAILVGFASLVAVIAKLSFLSEFLSRPILLGYMAGLALAVIASQAPKLFGIEPLAKSNFFTGSVNILANLNSVHLYSLLLSVILGIASYLILRYSPKLPVSIIILFGVTLLSYIFDFEGLGIEIVGTLPSGLPIPSIPEVSLFDIQQLIVPAFAIMAVSYTNTITTARSFAAKKNDQIDSNQELTALGMSSIAAGLSGGLPVSASGVRTAVNEQTGAFSQVSQLIAAAMVGVALVFFMPMLNYLPLPALAVIIIIAVTKLFDLVELKSIWHAWRSEAVLAIVTVLGVTLLGIFQGLLLAIFLAIATLVRKSVFPTDAVLGRTEKGSIRDANRPPETSPIPGIIMYRFDAPLHFGNANYFRQRVLQLIDETKGTRWFLWNAETTTMIDSTAGAMLLALIQELKNDNITFCVARMKGPVRSTINRTNRLRVAFESIPTYPNISKTLAEFDRETDRIMRAEKLVKKAKIVSKEQPFTDKKTKK